MADTEIKRLEGWHGNIKRETSTRSRQNCTPTRWPSRPGEEQYEWEEPRVVGNTNAGIRDAGDTRKPGEEPSKRLKNKDNIKTESKLGGATNGTSSRVDPTTNRVDRLRLLGNGVVPQTAERALRILTERIK